MKIYLATWLLEKEQGNVLTRKDKRERLLSYFHLLEKEFELKDYIKTGMNNEDLLGCHGSRK